MKLKIVHHGDTASMTKGNPCGTAEVKSIYRGEHEVCGEKQNLSMHFSVADRFFRRDRRDAVVQMPFSGWM